MEGVKCGEKATGCIHFRNYADSNGYGEVHSMQRFIAATNHNIIHISLGCSICRRINNPQVCLHCVADKCLCKDHMLEHSKKTGHPFSVDIQHNRLYCSICGDFIYDHDFEEIALVNDLMIRGLIREYDAKEGLATLELLSPEDVDSVRHYSNIYDPISISGRNGIRGLINQGNTCFMNSPLQCLLHCPPLVEYFMCDNHSRQSCPRYIQKQACVACEFDSLITETYRGSKKPFAAHTLLYSVWKYVHHLAGYQQQDAQEFLIAFLELLHSNLGGMEKSCHCPVHSIFGGSLRSEIRCSECGSVSSSLDAFVDISLWIYNAKGEVVGSLDESLRNFSNVEVLNKFYCSYCEKVSECTKKLSFEVVPPILFLHIKRSTGENEKLSSHILFPQLLDITSYMHNRDEETLMELIGVVVHKGDGGYGHYIAYVKHEDEWYLCDDGHVSHASAELVMESEAYFFFKHKHPNSSEMFL